VNARAIENISRRDTLGDLQNNSIPEAFSASFHVASAMLLPARAAACLPPKQAMFARFCRAASGAFFFVSERFAAVFASAAAAAEPRQW